VFVRVENPLAIARPDEVVALSWTALVQRLPALAPSAVRAVDTASGAELAVQVLRGDGDARSDSLLVQLDLRAGESRVFRVEAQAPTAAAKARAFGAHIDERDDLAWENDRVAFRTYGVGLAKVEPLVSSGMDVWTKRTRDLIVEKWYSKGHDDYHKDTGEGADFFDVGTSLGAGGTAVWSGNQMHRSRNFAAWRLLANGPVRVVFELKYAPWQAGAVTVSEVKRISLDAGANLNRNVSVFSFAGADSIAYVTGVVKRAGLVGATSLANPWAWVSGWGPVSPKGGGHGELGTAVLIPRDRLLDWRETGDHYLAIATARPGVPVVHYFGAGWTASGDVADVRAWWRSLDELARRLAAPVRTTIITPSGN
jgi:pectinesterase